MLLRIFLSEKGVSFLLYTAEKSRTAQASEFSLTSTLALSRDEEKSF